MTWLALLALLLAVVLFWISTQQRRHAGLPGGRVIYADTRAWGKPLEKPLYDSFLGLTGKPDYLVEEGDQIIPVEVKSTNVTDAPYDSHIYQLASYCMLVERTFGKRPRYGILHYPRRTFAIDFTPELESSVMRILMEMLESRKDFPRSHNSPQRCARCGFRSVCDQALGI
jgi:CRISPR-associated exonuclease Cas4